MDCKAARELLFFVRPKAVELSADDSAALQAHLHCCPECGPLTQAERQVDEAIAQAMAAVPIPIDLSQRIQVRLRRTNRVRLRRRALTLATAAVVLVAATLSAWYWQSRSKPVIDVSEYAQTLRSLEGAPPEVVERDLYQKFGVRTVVPRILKYEYYYAPCIQELYGRRVPCLLFFNEPYRAEVKILSSGQFDLETSLRQSRGGSEGLNVILGRDPDNPEYAYLITYTGQSIDWLFKDPLGAGR
jgi:hypothetical protein